jgi:hypothetical protein
MRGQQKRRILLLKQETASYERSAPCFDQKGSIKPQL